jgi:hypothetical protein
VHVPYGGREPRIGQPAQEPRRRIVTRRRPQRLDEKDFHQPGQHQLATRSLLARFVAHQPHQHRQALDAAHVQHRGQERHQQRRVGRGEDEVAAQQAHVRAPAARAVADFTGQPVRHLGVEALRSHRLEA